MNVYSYLLNFFLRINDVAQINIIVIKTFLVLNGIPIKSIVYAVTGTTAILTAIPNIILSRLFMLKFNIMQYPGRIM